jgi:hypothetical protein
MRNPEPPGDVGRARLAGRVDQVRDQFDVILRHLHLMRFPHPLEIGCLPVGIRHSLTRSLPH